MSDYRHVCFKDLENYFKRSDYFGNLKEVEKEQIRKNLNLPTIDDIQDREEGVVEDTYENIKKLADEGKLNLNSLYIINDFQTIYESNTGYVWGTDDLVPSAVYSIILHPISTNQFSVNVEVMENGIVKNWVVRYDITQKEIRGIKTKGEIIYLQDQNNNIAHYDFKNIRYEIYVLSTYVPALDKDTWFNLYTFSRYEDGEFVDNSESSYVMNNTFEKNCSQNIFLGDTYNNYFCGGFKNNIFTKNCTNNKFEWDTSGNKFTGNISYTQGSIQNAEVTTTVFESAISKEFKMVHTTTGSDPVFVVTYLDGDTLTNQVIKLNNA